MDINSHLSTLFNNADVTQLQQLQSLWSGYGSIKRYRIDGNSPASVIVKSIQVPDTQQHPRGWNTQLSNQRKLRSYEVECHWYQHWASICDSSCSVPHCYGVLNLSSSHQCIVLEDLDLAGFPSRHTQLSAQQCLPCLSWLANFHAAFVRPNDDPNWTKSLWPQGCYWHLETRPDEWQAMADSPLKQAAQQLDLALQHTRYTTLVHGDAKVANFCFSEDSKQVAAVDFQYVGAGCGMKDVIYFLGSCLSEEDCHQHHQELLDLYFSEFRASLARRNNSLNAQDIESEWRRLYPLAWADFQRFILGWSPSHKKNTEFARQITQQALDQLAASV